MSGVVNLLVHGTCLHNNILYLKSPINVSKESKAYVDATVNIFSPLTALCFGTNITIDSSNCTFNSIWLFEQPAAQMCNSGRKHQRYLAAV